MDHIKYKDGYKYQLFNDYTIATKVYPAQDIKTRFIELTTEGILAIRGGYASDGPSGPTLDTKTFMRGAFVHDALYQLMRMGLLSLKWRKQSDKELRRICIEDKMNSVRAWWVYKGVRIGARSSALPKNKKKVHTAP